MEVDTETDVNALPQKTSVRMELEVMSREDFFETSSTSLTHEQRDEVRLTQQNEIDILMTTSEQTMHWFINYCRI